MKNKKELLKKFHKLDKKSQNEIRAEYKKKNNKEYRYSINLFCIYTAIGLVGLLGVYVFFKTGDLYGALIYLVAFGSMFPIVYMLRQSNEPFYVFLDNKFNKKEVKEEKVKEEKKAEEVKEKPKKEVAKPKKKTNKKRGK